MMYRGHVKDGVVILDEPVHLPDGLKVLVQVVKPKSESPRQAEEEPLNQKLLKYAGKAVGRPADMARNHDHYL